MPGPVASRSNNFSPTTALQDASTATVYRLQHKCPGVTSSYIPVSASVGIIGKQSHTCCSMSGLQACLKVKRSLCARQSNVSACLPRHTLHVDCACLTSGPVWLVQELSFRPTCRDYDWLHKVLARSLGEISLAPTCASLRFDINVLEHAFTASKTTDNANLHA